jgi:hypothetical protein
MSNIPEFQYNFAVDTELPQDWLNAATERLPSNYDPRGEVGWGYPPGWSTGLPVALTPKGVLILGALAR